MGGSRCALAFEDARIPLLDGDNLIGRGPEARVRVGSNRASRRHARIVVSGDGATLEDLGSKNGTSLNDRRLESPAVLSPGDWISLGQLAAAFRFVIVEDGATASDPSGVSPAGTER